MLTIISSSVLVIIAIVGLLYFNYQEKKEMNRTHNDK